MILYRIKKKTYKDGTEIFKVQMYLWWFPFWIGTFKYPRTLPFYNYCLRGMHHRIKEDAVNEIAIQKKDDLRSKLFKTEIVT